MEVTRISVDAPQSFTDAHRAAKRCPRQAEVSYSGVDEAAYVLPAGQSILAATMKSREQLARSGGNKGYKIYTDGGKKVSRPPVPVSACAHSLCRGIFAMIRFPHQCRRRGSAHSKQAAHRLPAGRRPSGAGCSNHRHGDGLCMWNDCCAGEDVFVSSIILVLLFCCTGFVARFWVACSLVELLHVALK